MKYFLSRGDLRQLCFLYKTHKRRFSKDFLLRVLVYLPKEDPQNKIAMRKLILRQHFYALPNQIAFEQPNTSYILSPLSRQAHRYLVIYMISSRPLYRFQIIFEKSNSVKYELNYQPTFLIRVYLPSVILRRAIYLA